MALSGACDVTSGVTLTLGQKATKALLNLLGKPVVRVAESSITERELNTAAVIAFLSTQIGLGLSNKLINGNFDIWQRGGWVNDAGLPETFGSVVDSQFTADRWSTGFAQGTDHREISRGAFAESQTQVPHAPIYYLTYKQLVGNADETPTLSQAIEDVRTLAGLKVTVSGWLKSNASQTVKVSFHQYYETGDVVDVAEQNVAVVSGAAWEKFELIFDIPAMAAGHTLQIYSALTLRFSMPANTTFNTSFAQIKVEEGGQATAFNPLSVREELQACERYFEYSGGTMITAKTNTQTLTIPVNLSAVDNGDVLTNYVPGFAFKIIKAEFAVSEVASTPAKAVTLNLEINTTDLTGGVIALTSANCTPEGVRIAGTAITALNVGTATDSISVEASSVTKFVEGRGFLLLEIQNLEAFDNERPCFYFSTVKYRDPYLSVIAGFGGTGGTFEPIINVGYRQITPNSVVANFFILADAEIESRL